MTQHSKIGEGVEAVRAVTAEMRRFMPNACGDWADKIDAALAAPQPLTAAESGELAGYIHGKDYRDNTVEAVEQRRQRFNDLLRRDARYRQSLAREPATADVGRVALAIHGVRFEDEGPAFDDDREMARAAISVMAAPSSEPAIAEGERKPVDVTAMVSEALGDHQVGNRPALKKRLIADIRAALATTPPTTNDAIPAGMMAEIVEAAKRDIARTQTDFLGRMAECLCTYEGLIGDNADGDLSDDDREEADEAITGLAALALAQAAMLRHPDNPAAALSAAPSAPATEAGEEV